jgi:hypothetical protein
MIAADREQSKDSDKEPFLWLRLALFLPVRPFQTNARLRALLRAVVNHVKSGACDAAAKKVLLEAELLDEEIVPSESEPNDPETWDHL